MSTCRPTENSSTSMKGCDSVISSNAHILIPQVQCFFMPGVNFMIITNYWFGLLLHRVGHIYCSHFLIVMILLKLWYLVF